MAINAFKITEIAHKNSSAAAVRRLAQQGRITGAGVE